MVTRSYLWPLFSFLKLVHSLCVNHFADECIKSTPKNIWIVSNHKQAPHQHRLLTFFIDTTFSDVDCMSWILIYCWVEVDEISIFMRWSILGSLQAISAVRNFNICRFFISRISRYDAECPHVPAVKHLTQKRMHINHVQSTILPFKSSGWGFYVPREKKYVMK